MKRIISLLVVMAMMLASVLAVIPVSATGSTDNSDAVAGDTNNDATTEEEVVETTRFLPAGVLDAFKAAFEGADAPKTNEFVNGVTPFAFNQTEAQAKFSGKRILNITLPVKTVGSKFTISVFDMDDLLVASAPIEVYEITVDAANLTAGKMATIDLTSYEINVGPGETLAFGSATDTLLPAWYPGESGFTTMIGGENGLAPWTTGIIGNAGKANPESQPGNSIFFDFEMRDLTDKDGVVGTAVTTAEEFAAMKNGYNYYLTDSITLPQTWESKALENVTFDGNGKTITLSGTNGLFGDITNSTVKNFTLAGDVTTTTGVTMKANGATYRNITVDLKAIENSGTVGALATFSTGNVTIESCVNNTPIKGNDASGAIGKCDIANLKITVTDFENNAPLNGTLTAGSVMGWWNKNGSLVIREAVNTANVTAQYVGGFVGAGYGDGIEIYDSVNGVKDAETPIVISGGSGDGVGGFIGNAYNVTIDGSKNYANVQGTRTVGGIIGIAKRITKISNTENYGNVTATAATPAGGFIGSSVGSTTYTHEFENCVNYGNVTATAAAPAGGFIGECNNALEVKNCANRGAVGANLRLEAGGLVGKPTGRVAINIDGFTNTGDITCTFTAGAIAGWYMAGALTAKNVKNSGTITGSYVGGLVGAQHGDSASFDNCENNGEVVQGTSEMGAGGFIGESDERPVEIKNSKNTGKVTGINKAGGFIGQAKGNVTIENSSNTGELVGGSGTYGGGIVAFFKGAKFEATNVTTEYAHNVTGAWNVEGGGFIGTVENTNAELLFTNCINKTNLINKGGNPGGFVGGTVVTDKGYGGNECPVKSITFVGCINEGAIESDGCTGGFVGQGSFQNFLFINCVNKGDVTTNNNVAGGFITYGASTPVAKFVGCANFGNITAKNNNKSNKTAAGFSSAGAKISAEGCANYGTVTVINNEGNAYAAGLFAASRSGSVAVNCFNAGAVNATTKYEFSNSISLVDCITTGLHADLLAKAKELPTYTELVEKDEWQAVLNAFAAAKAVYDNAESTTADKKAALELVDAAVDDTNTYVLTDKYAVRVDDPSLIVTYSLAGAKKTDYIALVKKGDAEATITVLLEEIAATENFDLFTKLADETNLTEGNYTLYLVSKDVALADVIADPDKAYDAVEILIAVNVISTPEEFMAIAGTDGDYVLANDVAVPGNITFAGSLNGLGNTVTLTGNTGLFWHLNGTELQTIKNLKLAHSSSTSTTVSYGLIYTHSNDVTVEDVEIGTMTIVHGDRAGAIIATVDNNLFNNGTVIVDNTQIDIVIRNVKSLANVDAVWCGGGLIGRALVRSITIDNAFNGAEGLDTFVDANANNSSGDFGAGGLLGYVSVLANDGDAYGLNITNSKNYAKVTTHGTKGGGIVGDFSGDLYIEDVVNYGNIQATPGNWAHGEGGIVGFVRTVGTLTFKDVDNYGSILTDSNTNKGGFIGMINDGKACTVSFTDCENYGKLGVDTNNNLGGFIGQAASAAHNITISNCVNHADITNEGACAGGIFGKVEGNISMNNVQNLGNISGKTNTGGIIGFYAESASADKLTLKNVTNGSASKKITVKGLNNGANYETNGVGGIIGVSNKNDIYLEKVYNYADVSVNGQRDTNVGGIVGQIGNGGDWYFEATDCANYGNVTGFKTYGAAGFIGHIKWPAGKEAKFLRCDNYGTINSVQGAKAAGFIGYAEGDFDAMSKYSFDTCNNYGDITATNAVYLGGFIAYAQNANVTFKDSNNRGNIKTTGEDAGGFIGRAGADYQEVKDKPCTGALNVTFTNSNNYGSISSTASGNLGGFVGRGKNQDNVFTFNAAKNYGNVATSGNAGGFIGQPDAGTMSFNPVTNADGVVSNCENNGNITSSGNYAGGINGWGRPTVVANGFINNGTILVTADTSGNKVAAGLVTCAQTITINNCVNNGTIVSTARAGGFCGDNGPSSITTSECINTGTIISNTGNAWAGCTGAAEGVFVNTGLIVTNFDPSNEATFIEIWTAEEFMNMKEGLSYVLMDDIVLPLDYESIAIGFNIYTNVIDGNGHTIYMKGLSCPLFSTLKSVTIKDLTVVGTLDGARAVIAEKIADEVLVNTAYNITIDNVIVDVDIKNESGKSVGGFIAESGTVGTKVTTITITDSKFLGSISAKHYAGGFFGFLATKGDVTLTNCVVGDAGLNTSITGYYRVGGFAGKMRGDSVADQPNVTFNGCVNYADLTVEHIKVLNSGEGCVGGIGGRFQNMNLNLVDCSNYGKITNHRRFYTEAGGEKDGWVQGTGGLLGEINNNVYATFDSCSNYGEVYADRQVVGGIIGAVTNSSNITIDSCDNYGKVWNGTGWNFAAGGFVGSSSGTGDFLSNNFDENEIKIYDSFNYGLVTASNANIGGFFGMTDSSMGLLEIIGCYNYGDVICSGGNNAGGFVGQNGGCRAVIKNNVNFGKVKTNGCIASGALAYTWQGNWDSLVFEGNENYGTIENTNGDASGMIAAASANSVVEFNNNVNYGTVIASSGKGCAGLIQSLNGPINASGNANYGLVIKTADSSSQTIIDGRNDEQKAASNIASNNIVGGVLVSDPTLVELAKKVNAADYMLDDFVGIELNPAVIVDLASQIYVAQNGKDAASDFEFYYELALDAETNTLGASVYADKNTAVPAMTYATKLATISTSTYYEITLDAKNNTDGTNSGFVYAIAADGTVYSVVRDLDAEAAEAGYGQYKVVYNGLEVTVYVNTADGWTVLAAPAIVAEGTSVAVGIVTGASDYTYAEDGTTVVATPADNQNTATIANVTFAIKYTTGGIVNAFKALDTLDQNLAEAEALANTLKAVLAEAQTAHDEAKKAEDDAANVVDVKSEELADAVLAGNRDQDLDPYEKALADAIVVYERAHRDHEYTENALDTAKANSAKATEAYEALAASYKSDVSEAKANAATVIESTLNYAGYIDAMIAKMAMGDKFDAKYSQADKDAFNAAAAQAQLATTQADLDAAVEAMNAIVKAIDWSAYNYWLDVAESFEENDWTILTWEAFEEFLATLDEADKSTQEAVDALTEQIIAEIDKLVYDLELADEMQKYLDEQLEVRGWIEENYTPRSWKPFYATVIKPFQDAIDANKAARSAAVETTEQKLRAAYDLFNDDTEVTYTDLVYIAELNEILDLAKQITDDVTDEDEKTFSEISELYFLLAIPKAEIAHEDAMNEETTNEDAKQIIADAIAAIKPAYEGLVDVTELQAAIAGYEAEVVDKSYTAETWNAYALAVSKAEFAVVAAKSAEDVAEALAELEAAYDALVVLVAVDTEDLKDALDAVDALNEDDYTRDSWDALEDAAVKAWIAYYSDNQAMIDEAYAALAEATAALVLMPETESLEALIAEVEALKADDYTAKTWFVLVAALQDAKAALKSEAQEVVNEATDALAAAKAELVKKEAVDTTAIEALIAEIEALKADDYTSESWANVKTALDAAKAALESDEQTVVDVAKAALDAAKANLDKVVVVVEDKDDEEEEDEAPVQSTTETEKKGCKSAIGATVVVMTAVLGLGATVVLKKKED